jgi:peptidoglycan hydrolase CwlO-like protein
LADQTKKDEAQAQFTKAQKAEEGRKAMAEYEAEAVALRAKTARLKALRLAREAELAKNAPAKAAPKKRAARSAKAAPGKLADWLDDQEKSGRRS